MKSLMIKIIKILYKRYVFYFLVFFRNLFFFFLPNFNKIFRRLIIEDGVLWKTKRDTILRVNQKLRITGKGKAYIGNSCSFGYSLGGYYHGGSIEFQARYKESEIIIGNNISTNNNIFICCKVRISIGDNCLIGHNVELIDFDGHPIAPSERHNGDGLAEPILIGKNVWIGNNVMILRGTQIGDNTVIAAGSVVKGIFTSNVIIGGVPAKVIKILEVN